MYVVQKLSDMKRLVLAMAVIGIGMLLMTGCYYDKADQVYPVDGGSCDTSVVRLSVELDAIMSAHCYACHGGTADLGAGIQLQDYELLKIYADNGVLYSSISHDGGASNMPKGAPKLSDCDIAKFRIWIEDGAPNN